MPTWPRPEARSASVFGNHWSRPWSVSPGASCRGSGIAAPGGGRAALVAVGYPAPGRPGAAGGHRPDCSRASAFGGQLWPGRGCWWFGPPWPASPRWRPWSCCPNGVAWTPCSWTRRTSSHPPPARTWWLHPITHAGSGLPGGLLPGLRPEPGGVGRGSHGGPAGRGDPDHADLQLSPLRRLRHGGRALLDDGPGRPRRPAWWRWRPWPCGPGSCRRRRRPRRRRPRDDPLER